MTDIEREGRAEKTPKPNQAPWDVIVRGAERKFEPLMNSDWE